MLCTVDAANAHAMTRTTSGVSGISLLHDVKYNRSRLGAAELCLFDVGLRSALAARFA